jgi:hypothetical protein
MVRNPCTVYVPASNRWKEREIQLASSETLLKLKRDDPFTVTVKFFCSHKPVYPEHRDIPNLEYQYCNCSTLGDGTIGRPRASADLAQGRDDMTFVGRPSLTSCLAIPFVCEISSLDAPQRAYDNDCPSCD